MLFSPASRDSRTARPKVGTSIKRFERRAARSALRGRGCRRRHGFDLASGVWYRHGQSLHRRTARWSARGNLDSRERFELRLLLLSFYFRPDLSAGSFRASALVDSLLAILPAGASIDVITTAPNRYSTFTREATE